MGQVSRFLRRTERGYAHWCPGCLEPHTIYDSWSFNNNVDNPTFFPSIRITGKQIVKDKQGNWTGDWVRDAQGDTIDGCCHYFITDGILNFCSDSTHALAGQSIPLPELPPHMRDD